MKVSKGSAGYIRYKKMKATFKTVLEFGIVIALLILGIVETGDRMNLLTVVAILGCIPASKAMVELIMILPHRSIANKLSSEIDSKAKLLTKAYDMVFTSEKNIMPMDAIVISDNTICGYTSSKKVDVNIAAKHIKQYLNANRFSKVSVKIFQEYTAFITRAEGMNNIVSIEQNDTKEKEEAMRQVILNISL